VRQCGAVEVEPAPALEILWRDPAVVLADEFLGLRCRRLGQMLAKPGANAVYQSLIERVSASLRRPKRSGSGVCRGELPGLRHGRKLTAEVEQGEAGSSKEPDAAARWRR
jgi:hypothetical protein